jgi:hypothetical protein
MNESKPPYMDLTGRYVDPTSKYIDRVWEEYHKLKEELADERSKRKQIEELYDNLKADVAPLLKQQRNSTLRETMIHAQFAMEAR